MQYVHIHVYCIVEFRNSIPIIHVLDTLNISFYMCRPDIGASILKYMLLNACACACLGLLCLYLCLIIALVTSAYQVRFNHFDCIIVNAQHRIPTHR